MALLRNTERSGPCSARPDQSVIRKTRRWYTVDSRTVAVARLDEPGETPSRVAQVLSVAVAQMKTCGWNSRLRSARHIRSSCLFKNSIFALEAPARTTASGPEKHRSQDPEGQVQDFELAGVRPGLAAAWQPNRVGEAGGTGRLDASQGWAAGSTAGLPEDRLSTDTSGEVYPQRDLRTKAPSTNTAATYPCRCPGALLLLCMLP
jgi:hypothetical protein